MIANTARRLLRRAGMEVTRRSLYVDDYSRLAHFLHWHQIDLVLDVGANVGQFALALIDGGYRGRIASFEPLPGAHVALTRMAAKHQPQWTVMPRMALSDTDGTATFHVAANGASSSLLAMSENLTEMAPETREIEQIEVQTARFDTVLSQTPLAFERAFLKIDVQGAEPQVLAGAEGAMPRIHGLELELSCAPIYAGQVLDRAIHDDVTARGFELWDMAPAFRDNRSFRMMQYDAIYFRPRAEAP